MGTDDGLKSFSNQVDKSIFSLVLCFVFVFFLGVLLPTTSQAQVVNPSITFSVGPCTLDVALEKLFADYEVNVAFSKAELSKVEIPAYSCSYKPLDDVLSDLLRETGFNYKKIGRQYIIKKIPVFEPVPPQNQQNDPAVPSIVENHKIDTVVSRLADTVRIFDTLFVTRILLIRDTVVKTNTVIRHDTTYIRKRNPIEFNWPPFRNVGWFGQLSYLHEWGEPELFLPSEESEWSEWYGRSVCSMVRMDGLLAEGGHKDDRWSYGANLSYRSLRYDLAFDRTITTGGYYVNDTLDSYYVVNPFLSDTSYFYILDSVYVPFEAYSFAVHDVNRLNYLGVGLFGSFDFLSFDYFRMYVKASVSLDFLLNVKGTTFAKEAPFHTEMLCEQVAPVRFNYRVGVGAALKVAERMELVTELDYHGYTGSLFREDYPIGMKPHFLSILLGMTYYF